jgi:ribosomal protein S8
MNLVSFSSNINLCLKKKKFILLQKRSKVVIKVLDALWDDKIIIGYRILNKNFIKIYLKFNNSGDPLIKKLDLISLSGRRRYISAFDMKTYHMKKNIFFILSTTAGVLGHNRAYHKNLGGELLLKICV